MKITAEFESVDFADIAAAAVRKSISKMTEVKITPSVSMNRDINPYPPIISNLNFNTVGPNYTVPLAVSDIMDNGSHVSNNISKAYMEVICRQEEAKKVSQAIIGHGGRNISKI